MIWTAGSSPHPTIDFIPAGKERGLVKVNEFLEVSDCNGIWALGDCAAVPDLTTGKLCPPTAQHASRQGTVLAKNIIATIQKKQKTAFKFATIGLLAAIGKRTGVAQIMGFKFSGFIAWFMWRSIYLLKLPTIQKKVRVAWDWTLNLIFEKDFVQYSLQRSPVISNHSFEFDKVIRDNCSNDLPEVQSET